MKLEIVHADTCLSCYWPGHHKAHIQIPVWRGMSLKDIKQSLKNELVMGVIGGSDELAELLNCNGLPIDRQNEAEKAHKRAIAAINRIKPKKKGQRRFFMDLEEQTDEYDESVYAFFVFVEID